MPDLTLYCDPARYGVAALLEKVLPEAVLHEIHTLTGEAIPLRHVNFRVVEGRVHRTGLRYGYAQCLHIETRMPQFRGDGGKALGTAVRRNPSVATIVDGAGGGFSVRVTVVDATWSDSEDDAEEV